MKLKFTRKTWYFFLLAAAAVSTISFNSPVETKAFISNVLSLSAVLKSHFD